MMCMARDARREFDGYVSRYRETQNRQIALSGESGESMARYKVAALARWLGERRRPTAILDYGCGDGLMTSFLRERFPDTAVHGADSSPESIAHAVRTHGQGRGITFTVLPHATLPYPGRSFDLVVASGVFHHIPLAEHRVHLDEIFRILRFHGVFAMFEMNPLNPYARSVFSQSEFDRNAAMMPRAYAKRLLAAYGAPDFRYCAFFPAWLGFLRRLDPWVERIPLGALYAVLVERRPAGARAS